MHIDDTLVYVLALVTVAVLMGGLAYALQGEPQSPEARRRAMLTAHRRSTGLLIGTFAPPPALQPAVLAPAPMARSAVETVTAVVGAMRAAAPPEPIPTPAPAALESLPADIGVRIEPVYAPDATDATPTEQTIPLDAAPALLALTAELARPDAIVALDAAPAPETLDARAATSLPVAETPVALTQPIAAPAVAAGTPMGRDAGETDDVTLCLRAYEAGEHAAVGEAAARLARTRSGAKRAKKFLAAPAPGEQVAVWSILGLSRRALGEAAGARAAFDSAARWLPSVPSDLPAPLVNALPVLGQHLLRAGENTDSLPEIRYLALRLAVACLGWSTAGGAPSDDVVALAARARVTFAEASEQRIVELIGRRDFTAAQRLVRETLGSPLIGDDRRGAFRDLVWTTLTAEVDGLVGEARDGRRVADPLKGLAAAAAVVSAIPADLVSAARREDLARRVWAGHLRLGLARAEQGDLDGAMAPLVHAVETSASDPDRHAEACAALARTVEVLVQRLGAESLTELRDGDLDAALAASRRLSEVLDQALERGLSPNDLRPALERRQDVLLSIAEGRLA